MKEILFCSVAMFSSLSYAGEPIGDKDAFESSYVKCIESEFSGGCWPKIFSGHFAPWVKQETELLEKSEAAYTNWLGGQKTYKVHRGIKEIRGEIFDNRSYLIERDDGVVVGLWITFREVKGRWFLSNIAGAPSDEAIRAILNMTNPNAK
ncbi:hypothetical protein [Pseudomonas sp. R151218B TE3479]